MDIDAQSKGSGTGKFTIYEMIFWLGQARKREQLLEAMAGRADLSSKQRAQVATLLQKLRSDVRQSSREGVAGRCLRKGATPLQGS